MPYYVYAIHTDQTSNRLYQKHENHAEAAKLEADMMAGRIPSDNYFVRMFFAENDAEAEANADSLRPFPRRPGATKIR